MPGFRLRRPEYGIVHGVVEIAAREIVEQIRRRAVLHLDGGQTGALFVQGTDNSGDRIGGGVARLVALGLDPGRQIGDGRVGRRGLYRDE